jgi:hypothetical protein
MCDTQRSKFKSEEDSVGSGTHVANDRSSFTSPETDCTSNGTQVARKQHVDRRRIIHVDQLSNFEPIMWQNFRDGDKDRSDLPHVGWS